MLNAEMACENFIGFALSSSRLPFLYEFGDNVKNMSVHISDGGKISSLRVVENTLQDRKGILHQLVLPEIALLHYSLFFLKSLIAGLCEQKTHTSCLAL